MVLLMSTIKEFLWTCIKTIRSFISVKNYINVVNKYYNIFSVSNQIHELLNSCIKTTFLYFKV